MTPEEKLEKELESLTDEELAEYEQAVLAQKETSLENNTTAADAVDMSSSPDEILAATQQEGTHPVASLTRGAIEMIPGAESAVAAVETAKQLADGAIGFNIDELGKEFRHQRDVQQALYEQAGKDNPFFTTAGEVLGGVASFTGAGQIGLATKGVASIGTTTALATAKSIENNYDLKAEELLPVAAQDAATAALMDGLFMGAGRLASAGFRKAKGAFEASIQEAFAARSGDLKEISKHLRKTKQSLKDFSSTFFKDPEKPLIKAGNTFVDTLDNVVDAKRDTGQQLGAILSQIDDSAKLNIPAQEIENRLERDVISKILDSDYAPKVEMADKIRRVLKNSLYETTEQVVKNADGTTSSNITYVPKEGWGLSRIHSLYRDISNEVAEQFSKTNPGKDNSMLTQKKHLAGSLIRYMDDLVSQNGKAIGESVDGNVLKQYRQTKLDFQNLAVAEGALLNSADMQSADKGLQNLMGRMVGLKGFVLGSGLSMAAGLDPSAILPVSIAINALRANQGTASTVAVGAQRLASVMEKMPNSPAVKQIIRNLSAAASINISTFESELSQSIAKADLIDRPLSRDVRDVRARASHIYTLLNGIDENFGAEFQDTIENGDDDEVAAFMSEVAAMPQAKDLVEDGIGFNGKLYSPAEKEMMVNKIKAQRNLPRLKRLKIQQQIMNEGYIPADEELMDTRQPRQFIPRDKTKLRY